MIDLNSKTYLPIVFSSDNSFSIVNNGTAAAPCRLTIIPQNDAMILTIAGLSSQPIKVNRVMGGQILVIDGIEKTVTIDDQNAFDQFDAWEFPKLQVGTNIITITEAANATISIEYQPRYI